MRTFIRTATEAEKDAWIRGKQLKSPSGKIGKPVAERLGNTDRWKLYIEVED